MAHQRVEGNSNLVRDTNNGAILNINRNEFEKLNKLVLKDIKKNKSSLIYKMK